MHGMPKSIVFYRSSIFISSFLKELFKLQGVTISYLSAYHPQSNGQTECVNKYLKHFLICFTRDKSSLWFEWLTLAAWWYNTTFHTSTKLTPYEAVYAKPPIGLQNYIPGLTSNQAVEELLKTRDQILTTLKNNLLAAQERMKFQAYKNRTKREFSIRDWVYLRLQPYNIHWLPSIISSFLQGCLVHSR